MIGTYSVGGSYFRTKYASSNNIYNCPTVDIRWDETYTLIKHRGSEAIELIIFDPQRHKFDYLQQKHDDEWLIYWAPLHNSKILFMHFKHSDCGRSEHYKLFSELDFGADVTLQPGQRSTFQIETEITDQILIGSTIPYSDPFTHRTDPIFIIKDFSLYAKIKRGYLIREVFYRMLIRNLNMTLLIVLPQDLINLLVEYLAEVVLPDKIHSKLL